VDRPRAAANRVANQSGGGDLLAKYRHVKANCSVIKKRGKRSKISVKGYQ